MQLATDGRRVRGQRTRSAIVDAHVALLRSGNLAPTGLQIATRAGVSLRTLWTHFAELEELFAAVASEVLAQQDAQFRAVDPSLALAQRIDAFSTQRALALEQIAPFARASAAREPLSPVLRDYHRIHLDRVRDEVRVLFRAELDRRSDASQVVDALAAATTWGSWSTLRDRLGLNPRRSRSAMARTVAALLQYTPTDLEEIR